MKCTLPIDMTVNFYHCMFFFIYTRSSITLTSAQSPAPYNYYHPSLFPNPYFLSLSLSHTHTRTHNNNNRLSQQTHARADQSKECTMAHLKHYIYMYIYSQTSSVSTKDPKIILSLHENITNKRIVCVCVCVCQCVSYKNWLFSLAVPTQAGGVSYIKLRQISRENGMFIQNG